MREAVQSVPHWHLPFIGVDPSRRGLGLGSLLLRAGLSRIDEDGVECRLFTETPRNVSLYQRYGFEIAVEGDVPDGDRTSGICGGDPAPSRDDRPSDGGLPGVRRPPRRETPWSTCGCRHGDDGREESHLKPTGP